MEQRISELEKRVTNLEKKATAATAAQKVTVNIPDGLKPRDVVEQLEKIQKEYIRSLPINF